MTVSAVLGVLGFIVSVVAMVLLVFSYLQRNQIHSEIQTGTWVRTFADVHEAFWAEDNRNARSWLAYDAAYQKGLKPVLERRLRKAKGQSDPPPHLNAQKLEKQEREDQAILDQLDRTLGLLCRAVWVSENFQDQPEHVFVWRELIYDYWVHACFRKEREELVQYISLYWKHFYTVGTKDVENAGNNKSSFNSDDATKCCETALSWLKLNT